MKTIRSFVAALAVIFTLVLPALASERWVGVFIPQQDPLVDNFTKNKNADQYFMPLWHLYQKGRIQGAVSDVRLFLLDGDRQTTIYNGIVDGYKYVGIERSAMHSSTLLCVQVPWPIIAHQRVAAGDRIMCERGVDEWFRQGRGMKPEDAWGVIAIRPAGS
jgi:hypothetical protein